MSRRSHGGRAVEAGLAAVGLSDLPDDVALVETARPRRHGHRVVLAQNAWTVLPRPDFRRLAAPYDLEGRARHRARRVVAAVNLRRAGTVLTLSHAMAALVRARGVAAEVSPLTLPLDLCRPPAVAPSPPAWLPARHAAAPLLVVPGSVTSYKAPEVAADLARRAGRVDGLVVVLAGPAEPSVLAAVRAASPVPVLQGTASRAEMRWLLAAARLTLLPSRLESLGFGLAEGLACSARVAASPLPAHREVAGRLGREPRWLLDDADLDATAAELASPCETGSVPGLDPAPHVAEWEALARRLA